MPQLNDAHPFTLLVTAAMAVLLSGCSDDRGTSVEASLAAAPAPEPMIDPAPLSLTAAEGEAEATAPVTEAEEVIKTAKQDNATADSAPTQTAAPPTPAPAPEPAPAPVSKPADAQKPPATAIVDCQLVYVDVDKSYSVSSGDGIQVAPGTPRLKRAQLGQLVPGRESDSLGTDFAIERNARAGWRLVLGTKPQLTIGYGVAGSPAGRSELLLAPGGPVCSLRDSRIDELATVFDQMLQKRGKRLAEMSSGGNGFELYNLSGDFEGLLSMFEATGNTKYLQRAVQLSLNIVRSGKDLNGDGYVSFEVKGKGAKGIDLALYEWRGMRPVARTARLVSQDKALAARYEKQYREIEAFLLKQVYEKWSEGKSKSPRLPHFETDGLIHRSSHMGDILVDLTLMTGRSDIEASLALVAKRVEKQLRASKRHPGAVEWNILYKNDKEIIRNYERPLGVSDTSHASGTVSFIAADAALTRSVFGRPVVESLSFTLSDVIYAPRDGAVHYTDFVDGATSETQPDTMGLRNLSDGWVKLGMFDANVQRLMMTVHEQDLQASKKLQLAGNLARNFAQARWQ
ncbi:MAG: hypothetical protein AAFN78_00115 [Pseudomonadota bacterium]